MWRYIGFPLSFWSHFDFKMALSYVYLSVIDTAFYIHLTSQLFGDAVVKIYARKYRQVDGAVL